MDDGDDMILRDAAARGDAAVLSLPSVESLLHFETRFLGERDDGVLIELPPGETALVESLIESGQQCAVAFQSGHYNVKFAGRILKVIPQWPINETESADAILIDRPNEIETIQRRAHHRAKIPSASGLTIRAWRVAEHAVLRDVPLRSLELACELRDLSVGGAGVRFIGKDGKSPILSTADRLRIQITVDGEPFILEARMREPHVVDETGALITGIAFKKLDNNFEGRQAMAALARAVGKLQRHELRQRSMDVAPTP
jgi:c-di-GMP-binding flagellar brake protein YcgR